MTGEKRMTDREEKMTGGEIALDLIYLAGCACNGLPPSARRVEAMDLEKLHALSRSLSLNSLISTAFERADFSVPETPTIKKWRGERDLEIYKSLMFDREWEKFRAFLEGEGIWHLLLKGLPNKAYYPEPGTRQMADVDVLIDVNFDEKIREWFLSQGYQIKTFRQGLHDSYVKPPFYNFEPHRGLFSKLQDPAWADYYAHVKNRVVLNDGSKYGHHFTDDDFYVYCTVHACKHYSSGGTGLRTLLDNYLHLKSEAKKLDFKYIEGELKKLGIENFERNLRTLASKLFAEPENFTLTSLDENERTFLDDFLNFGTYGTFEKALSNRLDKFAHGKAKLSAAGKAKYLWTRLFPSPEVFRINYPFFYRHRLLLPVGYAYRLFYRGFIRRKNAFAELRYLMTRSETRASRNKK